MGEPERRQITILAGKPGQAPDHNHEPAAHQAQRFGHDDQVGIVSDITGRGAEVDDAGCLWTLTGINMDVRHDVVADLPLFPGGRLQVDVIEVIAQFCDLFGGDGQAQIAFCFSQG